MGFLSKAFKKVKKQIQPNNMMIGSLPKRPRRGGGFLSKIRNKAFDRIESGKIPARSGFLRGQYFGPPQEEPMFNNMRFRGEMPRDGGMGGLGEAIRRLQEQQRMMPQPIPERMPVNNVPSFNPTIFGQPISNFDFGNMPNFSIDDIMKMPQAPTQMPMTQDLPEVSPVGMMPQMRMGGMQDMEPRMMMQEGEDVSLERELFSLQAQLKNLEEQLRLDRSYNDDQAVIDTSAKMASIQKRIQEIMNSRPQLEGGGDFPDLTGDGKVTQADILKGRGVQLKAEGGEMMMEETEMMAPSGDEIEASLMEVQGMQPEMQALDQFVQMVIQMIQAGASEAEVIESLRQAGLDDEDIAAVFQAVMETMQGSMEQDGIGAELEQLV